jgi:hypothetical protein
MSDVTHHERCQRLTLRQILLFEQFPILYVEDAQTIYVGIIVYTNNGC